MTEFGSVGVPLAVLKLEEFSPPTFVDYIVVLRVLQLSQFATRFCSPVAIPGDSGSLLINADTNEATGLVFARVVRQINGVTTYPYGLANHIQTVLDLLGVTLAV